MSHSVIAPSQAPRMRESPTTNRAGSWWRRTWALVRRGSAAVMVVAALTGLAVWGHLTDWTLPKFSTIFGHAVAHVEGWCKEHNVPESQCIECNPSLVPRSTDYGWCKEHGVSQCPLDHPDVAQLKTVPTVSEDDLECARRALTLRPRTENNSRCKLYQRRIQFASIAAVEKVGLDITVAQRRPIIEAVIANGEVVYDETHSAHLASRVAGSVWRVEKQIGERVRKGEVLALIDAVEVGRAKAEFLQAIAQLRLKKTTVDRLKPLADEGAVPARQFREAEAAFQEAEIRLLGAQQTLTNLGFVARAEDFADLSTEQIAERIQLLGLPPDTLASFDGGPVNSNLFPLRAPLDGVVVSRKVVPGEVVDNNTTIFGVADLRQMWLVLDVRQDEAKYLSLGQLVHFRAISGKDEPEVKGKLTWISTEADNQTRTIKVRVDLPNDDGRLRANTFGTGRIVLREDQHAIVIPSEAVHRDGCCDVVFVRDRDFLREGSPKCFHVRQVRIGVKDGDATEIIVGLLPGEVIAAKNSVVLEAQLLKGNLGAGCGCADGK